MWVCGLFLFSCFYVLGIFLCLRNMVFLLSCLLVLPWYFVRPLATLRWSNSCMSLSQCTTQSSGSFIIYQLAFTSDYWLWINCSEKQTEACCCFGLFFFNKDHSSLSYHLGNKDVINTTTINVLCRVTKHITFQARGCPSLFFFVLFLCIDLGYHFSKLCYC